MAEHSPVGAEELRLHLLVLRCQAGDERAFARLMDEYGKRTRRYLAGLVGDAADDVQQEVWLTVYRSIARLSNPRAFRTWLFRTTRHRAIDFLRKKKREMELIADTPLEGVDASDAGEESSIPDMDEAQLNGVISQLPPAQREVLLLRYRDDMSYAEIALVVGCSIGTVRSRLHHAKRRMQELIEDHR